MIGRILADNTVGSGSSRRNSRKIWFRGVMGSRILPVSVSIGDPAGINMRRHIERNGALDALETHGTSFGEAFDGSIGRQNRRIGFVGSTNGRGKKGKTAFHHFVVGIIDEQRIRKEPKPIDQFGRTEAKNILLCLGR